MNYIESSGAHRRPGFSCLIQTALGLWLLISPFVVGYDEVAGREGGTAFFPDTLGRPVRLVLRESIFGFHVICRHDRNGSGAPGFPPAEPAGIPAELIPALVPSAGSSARLFTAGVGLRAPGGRDAVNFGVARPASCEAESKSEKNKLGSIR